jgi:hypothetical protein
VDAWLEQEYQLTPDAREALRSRFLEGNAAFFLPRFAAEMKNGELHLKQLAKKCDFVHI